MYSFICNGKYFFNGCLQLLNSLLYQKEMSCFYFNNNFRIPSYLKRFITCIKTIPTFLAALTSTFRIREPYTAIIIIPYYIPFGKNFKSLNNSINNTQLINKRNVKLKLSYKNNVIVDAPTHLLI